jgi:hypothetical protein
MIYSASYARFIFPHIFRLKKHTNGDEVFLGKKPGGK